MKVLIKICLIFLFSLFTKTIYCNSTIDSLKQIVQTSTVDTVKVSGCIALSKLYKSKLSDSASYFAHRAYHLSSKHNFNKGKIKAYINLSGIYLKSDPDSSLYYTEKVLLLIEPDDFTSLAKAYLNKGVANFYARDEIKAMKAYHVAAKYAKEANDLLMLTKLYNNMGNLIARQDTQKAKSYYKKALKTVREINNTLLEGHLLINLGGMYFEEGNYDTAKVMLREALMNDKLGEDPYTQAAIYANLGRIYNQDESYDSAIIVLNKGLEISKELKFQYGLQHNLQVLQSTYFLKKNYDKSIFYGNQILKEHTDSKDFTLLIDVNNLLAEAAEKKGDYEAAFRFQKESKYMSDSLNNRKQKALITELEVEFQSKEQEQQIKLLEQEKKTKDANYKALLIGIILSIGLLIIALLGYRQKQLYNDRLRKEVHRQTEDLKKKNEQLMKANNNLNQFNYIASHDVKEPIRVIGGYIQLINQKLSDKKQIELKEYFNTINKAIKQLYTLIEDIAKYTQYNQETSIIYSAVNLNEVVQNIEVGLEDLLTQKNGKITFDKLPVIQSNNSIIYIILKNLIQNGLKYNESNQPIVSISSTETATTTILNIQDNGIGIPSKYHLKIFEMFKRLHNREKYDGTGLGLSITKTIVEKIGGTISLESEIKKGTTFKVVLPK